MKLNALNRPFSDFVQNQISRWHFLSGGQPRLNQQRQDTQHVQPSAMQKRRDRGKIQPKLCVEDIEVSSDKKFMYCNGQVRSQGTRSRANVVVAIEWLNEDRQALNTDWKRIEIELDKKAAPRLADTMRPFMVKAPLDRRVKWVKAYAFSGRN